jgi:chromate transporter
VAEDQGVSASDLLGLFGHFLLLSMLAIGGAIATAPDMHRYVVVQQHWLTDSQFTSSVALAQAAPGPNLLFVAAIGWNIAGLVGVLVTMLGILLPSTTFTLAVSRWGHTRRESRGVRAFTAGMAPLTIGLVLATGWVLTEPSRGSPGAIALVVVSAAVMLRTRINPLWLVGLGAIVGGLGLA